MMIEYVWLLGLMIVSIVLSLNVNRVEAEGRAFDAVGWQIAAHGAALLAVVISWDRTGAVLLKFLLGHSPQAGSQISEFTAYVLVGAVGCAVVFAIPLAIMMMEFSWPSRKKKTV